MTDPQVSTDHFQLHWRSGAWGLFVPCSRCSCWLNIFGSNPSTNNNCTFVFVDLEGATAVRILDDSSASAKILTLYWQLEVTIVLKSNAPCKAGKKQAKLSYCICKKSNRSGFHCVCAPTRETRPLYLTNITDKKSKIQNCQQKGNRGKIFYKAC